MAVRRKTPGMAGYTDTACVCGRLFELWQFGGVVDFATAKDRVGLLVLLAYSCTWRNAIALLGIEEW